MDIQKLIKMKIEGSNNFSSKKKMDMKIMKIKMIKNQIKHGI
jgi:hypothetical protein